MKKNPTIPVGLARRLPDLAKDGLTLNLSFSKSDLWLIVAAMDAYADVVTGPITARGLRRDAVEIRNLLMN